MEELVTVEQGQALTSSRVIAEAFGKEHDNVLRAIRALDVPEEFARLNFEEIEEKDARGRNQPMYLLTRDGFTLLAMGFTGKKATAWKLKYLEAFNRMEAALRDRVAPLARPDDLQRLEDMIMMQSEQLGEIHKALSRRGAQRLEGPSTYSVVDISERAFAVVEYDETVKEAVKGLGAIWHYPTRGYMFPMRRKSWICSRLDSLKSASANN